MGSRLDRQSTFSGTGEVRPAHRFDVARLAAYLSDRIDGFCGPLSVEQFKGGQSNPTYKLSAPSGQYVLRRKPPGKLLPSAHAVDREYRAIAALHPTGFPVARPHLLCEDDGIVGTALAVTVPAIVEQLTLWWLTAGALECSMGTIMGSLSRAATASAIMALAVSLLKSLLAAWSPIVILLSGMTAGAVVYLALIALLDRELLADSGKQLRILLGRNA